jgi:hypothetical protein
VKNKKWLLVLIIAFPSLFWLILETSTINSRRLPFHGPKAAIGKGDTSYHRVAAPFLEGGHLKPVFADTSSLLFTACFLAPAYRNEGYRIAGLWEYLKFKKDKIAPLPVVLVTAADSADVDLAELAGYDHVMLASISEPGFSNLRDTYFAGKPYYVDYSFFVLVDAQRHIRGYYDARYASEIKRLLEEYQHLKLKEVRQVMTETNEIRTQN